MSYVPINPTYHEMWKSKKLIKWEKSYPPEYWEYRKKWHENPKKRIVGDFPLHLDFDITRKCNLRCPMCDRTILLERGEWINGEMDFKLAKKVIGEGSKNGLHAIKLSYLGEPLLYKNLPKLVKYAKDKGVIDVMFNTNGTLLTETMSEKLIDAGLDKIFISFDSPIKERYESVRVGAKFDEVIENVKSLIRLRNERNLKHPVVRVSMVRMKENSEEVPAYVKLWKPIVDIVAYVDYVNPQGMDRVDRYAAKPKLAAPNFVCSQLYQRLFIHYNGGIGLCCADDKAEMSLGNAWTDNIKDVWLGKKMQKIRKLHNEGGWSKVPVCAKCFLPYSP